MGYDYNISDAECVKEKLGNCQTEINNIYNSSTTISSSIYSKLHKNTAARYSNEYDLTTKPNEWIDAIDSILNNFTKIMEQLSEENTIQGEAIDDSVDALASNENANATGAESTVGVETIEELDDNGNYNTAGESSTVEGQDIIEELDTTQTVSGNGQESTVEESRIYTVNTKSGNLNVRDANGNVITSIPKDSTVKVIGETNENGYVKVEYGDGKTGFVYQDYLKETSENQTQAEFKSFEDIADSQSTDINTETSSTLNNQTQTSFESFEGIVDTKNTGLNIRTSPTTETNSNIIGSLKKGSNINIIGEEGDWYKISLDDGSEAYVYKQFIARR